VSRVGGNAQIKAMKQIAGSLRLDLAAFRELEAFAQLGTELDKATQAQLDRGVRMVELLKQPQYMPFNVVDQVISIYAGSKGYLDDVAPTQVPAFEQAMQEFFTTTGKPAWDALSASKKLDDATTAKLDEALKTFKGQWKPA